MKVKNLLIALLFSLISVFIYSQSIPNVIPKAKDKTNINDLIDLESDKTKPAEDKKSEAKEEVKAKQDEPKKQKSEPEKKDVKKEIPKEDKVVLPVKEVKKEEPVKVAKSKEESQKGPKSEKKYTEKGIVEIGGIVWGELRAFKGGNIEQQIWGNAFFSIFAADYLMIGMKADGEYNFDKSDYSASGYAVAGAAFPLTENLFLALSVNVGYAYSNMAASSSLFSYGNEVGFKIKLKEHFLLGISAVYSFYTDFSQEFFNDKVRVAVAFSGYF